jgi:hypothetical protein
MACLEVLVSQVIVASGIRPDSQASARSDGRSSLDDYDLPNEADVFGRRLATLNNRSESPACGICCFAIGVTSSPPLSSSTA